MATTSPAAVSRERVPVSQVRLRLSHVEVVDRRLGIGWVVGRLVELAERWQPCAVVVDDTGPAGSLIAPLEAAGLEVIRPTTRARAAADGGF